MLTIAILGGLLIAIRARPRWPIGERHQALVLWGGWLLVGGVLFSVAAYFHQYHLAVLGPPIVALAGIGLVDAWQWTKTRRG